jgi:threonine synthase
VLTGHVLKDPDYIYRYHTGQLEAPSGEKIRPQFANQPVTVEADIEKIREILERPVEPARG